MAMKHQFSRYRWVILGLALLSQCSAALVGQVLAPLAPLFQPELGLSRAEVGIFSSAAYAGAMTVLLLSGSLTDRFGVRTLVSLSQLFTGSLLLAMSMVVSAFQAAAIMFVAGVGRAPSFPGATKAIVDWFPPRARATAMGLKQTGMPIAGVITASTMPAIGLALGWRSAIVVAGLMVIASGIVIAVLYRDPPRSAQAPLRKPPILSGMKDVARNRRLWNVACIGVPYVAGQMALITYLALYLKENVLLELVPDESARIVAAGGYLALSQFAGVVGRVSWGAVSDRIFHGQRMVVLAIVGAISAASLLAVGYLSPSSPAWLLTAVMLISGGSSVSWNGVYHAVIGEAVERKYAATAVGLTMTMSEVGTLLGPPLFGLVVDLSASYRTAWLLASGLYAAGALIAILSAKREKQVSAESA